MNHWLRKTFLRNKPFADSGCCQRLQGAHRTARECRAKRVSRRLTKKKSIIVILECKDGRSEALEVEDIKLNCIKNMGKYIINYKELMLGDIILDREDSDE